MPVLDHTKDLVVRQNGKTPDNSESFHFWEQNHWHPPSKHWEMRLRITNSDVPVMVHAREIIATMTRWLIQCTHPGDPRQDRYGSIFIGRAVQVDEIHICAQFCEVSAVR